MWFSENFVESWHNASHNLDIQTKRLVAQDRKERILNLMNDLKKPNSLKVSEKIKAKIHHEVYDLKDSELWRVLAILNEDETNELISYLNEAQIKRINRLWNTDNLIVFPTKNKVSNIIEEDKWKNKIQEKKTQDNAYLDEKKWTKSEQEKKPYKEGLFEKVINYFDLDREVFKRMLWVKDDTSKILSKAA